MIYVVIKKIFLIRALKIIYKIPNLKKINEEFSFKIIKNHHSFVKPIYKGMVVYLLSMIKKYIKLNEN